MLHHQGQLRLVYGAGCGKVIHAVSLHNLLDRRCSRKTTLHPELHELLGEQPAAATAAEGPLLCNARVHVVEVVAHLLDNVPGLLNQVSSPGVVAGVVQRNHNVVVPGLVYVLQLALAQQVGGELKDVHELEGQGPVHRLHELPRCTPGVPALSEDDQLGAYLLGGLHHPEVYGLHVVVAEEEPEVRSLAGVGAHGPVRAYGVEHLGDAYHGVGVGEEVRARREVQDVSLLLVHGYLDINTRGLLYLLLQELAVVLERRLRDSQVVAVLVHLGDNLGHVLGSQPNAVEHLPARHGYLRLVNAVGAEHRAPSALRALVEVLVPLVLQYLRGELLGTHQGAEELAAYGEVRPVHLPEKLGSPHGGVLGVARAYEVVALLYAGAAAHAYVQVELDALPLLAHPVKLSQRHGHHLVVRQGLLGDVRRHDLGELGLGQVAHVSLTGSWLQLNIIHLLKLLAHLHTSSWLLVWDSPPK